MSLIRKYLLLIELLIFIVTPIPVLASRTVHIANLEAQAPLYNDGSEVASLKCIFMNTSTVNQTVTLDYYKATGTANSKTVLTLVSTPTGTLNFVLPPNSTYTAFFCKNSQTGSTLDTDCAETSSYRVEVIPLRITLTVSEDTGYLTGNCVSHYSDQSYRHRSSMLSIAGGRPF